MVIIRNNFYSLIVLLAFILPLQGLGQAKFYTSLSEQRVARNQTFQVQYTVEGGGQISELNLPTFADFKVEEEYDMQNMVVMGQNMQPVRSYSKVVVLSPMRKGTFVIKGATARIDGKLVQSNTVKVTVIGESASAQPAPSPMSPFSGFFDDRSIDTESESILQPDEDVEKKVKKNFFLRVEASKTSCYVGEPIQVVYKVYSRLNANSQVLKRPSFSGFSVMEMVDSYDSKAELEKLKGIPYYAIVIRKVQLFPLQEGDYTLDEASIESVVHFIKAIPGSVYGKNFDYNTTLHTDPVTIKVKPLPTEGQPADFSGAVGKFKLAVEPPPGSIHRGDLVKIRAVVSGKGNLSLITAPQIKWPKGVDTSEPEVKEDVDRYTFPLSGTKTFEYSFAANDTGDVVIPPSDFFYFDPADKKYKVATSAAVTLHVLPGMSKEKEDSLNTAMKSTGNKTGIPIHYYYFAGVVAIILGLVLYQLLRTKRNKETNAAVPEVAVVEEVPAPIKEVPPVAEIVLEKARVAMEHGQHLEFYRIVQDNLWKIAADCCEVPPSALNKRNITRELEARNVSPIVIAELTEALQECEWALYTPSADQKDMRLLLAKAERLVTEMQKVGQV